MRTKFMRNTFILSLIDFFLIFLNFVPLLFAEPFFAIKKVQSRPKYRLRPQPKNLGPDRLRNTDVNLAFFHRNPSLKQQLFSYAILGFALSEAMGLFCLMMAFLLLFAF